MSYHVLVALVEVFHLIKFDLAARAYFLHPTVQLDWTVIVSPSVSALAGLCFFALWLYSESEKRA